VTGAQNTFEPDYLQQCAAECRALIAQSKILRGRSDDLAEQAVALSDYTWRLRRRCLEIWRGGGQNNARRFVIGSFGVSGDKKSRRGEEGGGEPASGILVGQAEFLIGWRGKIK
jgi:hypothetical protein